MSTSRIWTIEEANALVPRLSSMIGRQLALASDVERCWQELVQAVQSPAATPDQLIEMARNGSELARARERELSEKIAAYESGWQEIEELGVVVKDQRIGLCDFYGRLDGALVWLCWRYGEPAVEHYHGLEAGYAGRKPITAERRRQLLN
ncbi:MULTISPECIES: DUF2203 domain-containing protein [Sorangium]|uniref:DUF2203 domain-containing protein n=1 Tax=Sorangium cellulosum (strain So ce56) TaxID=448385 RepID=A9GED0_SORC5|nr:DUF2203 domain-containing protein [Sorangium cellulosum]CAN99475.1 hypothetical protein sce9302 [Sorangium cellulosum So ce56]